MAFASVLNRNGLRVFEEVFTPKNPEPWAFYRFLNGMEARKLLLEPEAVLAEYLAFLGGLSSGRIGLEVKLNQLGVFSGSGGLPNDRPRLLTIFQRARRPIVHLWRRGLFAQAVSSELASVAVPAHVRAGEQTKATPTTIDPKSLLTFMRRTERASRMMRRWNARYPLFYEYAYEDVFENDALTDYAARRLSSDLELNITERSAAYRRHGHDLRSIILNRDEVLKAMAGTKYHDQAAALIG